MPSTISQTDIERAVATEAMARRMTNEQRLNGALAVVLPYSEVCCAMRVAGQTRRVIPLTNHMAWILNEDGSLFSFPVTRGEAGLR